MFDETYRLPGRPPRNPKNKVGLPIRCLVTPGVRTALDQLGQLHDVNISDVLRLALYRYLEAKGLMTRELRVDATWDELRKKGLV